MLSGIAFGVQRHGYRSCWCRPAAPMAGRGWQCRCGWSPTLFDSTRQGRALRNGAHPTHETLAQY